MTLSRNCRSNIILKILPLIKIRRNYSTSESHEQTLLKAIRRGGGGREGGKKHDRHEEFEDDSIVCNERFFWEATYCGSGDTDFIEPIVIQCSIMNRLLRRSVQSARFILLLLCQTFLEKGERISCDLKSFFELTERRKFYHSR